MGEELAQSRLGTPERLAALPLSEAQPVGALLSTGDLWLALLSLPTAYGKFSWKSIQKAGVKAEGHELLRIHGWALGARNPLKLYTNIVGV